MPERNNSQSANGSSAQVVTLPSFVAAGVNRLLVVDACHDSGAGGAVSGVTFNGVGLTLLHAEDGPSSQRLERWYLINPPATTADAVVTWVGTPTASVIAAHCIEDVNQSSPFGAVATNELLGPDATPTVNVDGAVGDLILDCGITQSTTTVTVGAGQTQAINTQHSNGGAIVRLFASTEVAIGAATTMSWTIDPARAWTVLGVAIKAPLPPPLPTGPLGLEVYERGTSTPLGTGLIVNVLAATITRAVDRIGAFSIDIPASDRQYALLTQGREVALVQEGVGTVWRGIVDTRAWRIDADGTGYLTIGGGSLALELQWESTYMGILIDDLAAGDAIDAIIDGTGWTKVLTGTGYQNLSNRYDNMTLWQALTDLAGIEGAYVRETDTAREVEMSRSTTDSGIILGNVESAGPLLTENPWLGLIEGLPSVREEGSNIVNRLVPIAMDEGNIVYDLGRSTRATPYTVQSFVKNRPSVTATLVQQILPEPSASSADPETQTLNFGTVACVGSNRVVVVFVRLNNMSDSFSRMTCVVGGILAEEYPQAENGALDSITLFVARNVAKGDVPVEVVSRIADNSGGQPILTVAAFAVQDVDYLLADLAAVGSGTGTTATVTIATETDDLRLGAVASTTAFSATSGADQTRLITDSEIVADSKAATGGTLTWTLAASEAWFANAIRLRGARTHYIEDATSVTSYGRRVHNLIDKGQRFVGATAAQLEDAANSLYDLAVTALERNKAPVTFYEVDVAHLPDTAWLVGDSMRLLYRGAAVDQGGEYVWLDVDADVKVMEATEAWDSAGVRHWRLLLSTVYRFPRTNDEVLGENLAKILSLESM